MANSSIARYLGLYPFSSSSFLCLSIGLAAATYFTFQIVLPGIKRVSEEKIVPFIEDKLDDIREKRRLKKEIKKPDINEASEPAVVPSTDIKCKIISFDAHQKEA